MTQAKTRKVWIQAGARLKIDSGFFIAGRRRKLAPLPGTRQAQLFVDAGGPTDVLNLDSVSRSIQH